VSPEQNPIFDENPIFEFLLAVWDDIRTILI